MNFSERGLAELVTASNDIVAVADDTEKSTDLAKALQVLTHQVPAGRSKQISKRADLSRIALFNLRPVQQPAPNSDPCRQR